MAKPFKIFLWIVGIFFLLIVGAVAAVPLLFNPNDYKDEAAVAAKDSTGRELRINGDIELTLFPWLGASVADVSLANVEGFGPEPFMQVKQMDVGVRLLPLLFKRRVEIGKIRIDGLALNLVKTADGHNNWGFESDEEETPEQPAPTPGGKPLAFSVGGLEITNATFSYTDKQAGSAYKVANLAIETGAIELGQPLDVAIAFVVNSAEPALESEVKIAFTALTDVQKQVHEIRELSVDTDSKGEAVPGGSQKASLRAASIHYDQGQGTFALADAVLDAAGLVMSVAVQGRDLTTDAPKLSGRFSTNSFNPKEVASSFGVALPPTADAKALTQASFAADYAGDFNSARLDKVTLKLDQTTAVGELAVTDFKTQAITFALKADSFDADRYLAPAAPEDASGAGKDGGDFKKTELPIDALDAVNARGTVELQSLTLKGVKMSNIRISLDAPKGQVKTEEMTAQLYGGKVQQSARIQPGAKPRYDLKMGLNGVNSAPLQQDFLGKQYLTGLGNFTLNVSSGGATVGDVLRALSGAVAAGLQNGAVEGFNLEQTLSGAKALYAGQPVPQSDAPKRTEFKDLKGSGKITNGVLDTDTLDVKGSWYQLGGDGTVDLVEQTVNYILYPTVSGEKFKDLAGTKIPVKVSGSWFDPKIKVDLEGVLKGRAKQEIEKQEDKLKEKARDKFGDFLRKNLGEPKQQPPAEQPKEEPAPSGT